MSAMSTYMEESIQAICDGNSGFDVVIICTTDDHQANYWMDLLSGSRAKVLAVSEDWNLAGGAGNGLGTLYAWQKACALATKKYSMDIMAGLAAGTLSAALYHTAGKGTRLAPLPASENNNKPGVKLPFPLVLADGAVRPLTVLEAVMRQTAIYARKGRLSVFWGDQVFLPSAPFRVEATHHIDILCRLLGDTAPSAQEWQEQGLDKYGVIAVLQLPDGNRIEAAQVEKVSHETATQMLSGLGGKLQQVGPSLGSFSVSSAMLQALVEEFQTELQLKNAKFDTDPHFWMPLTLSLASYQQLMQQKDTPIEEATAHYERMGAFKTKFLANHVGLGLFGAVNVGKDCCWWDYGLLKLYSKNSLLLLEPDSNDSAMRLRQFLGLDKERCMGSVMDTGAAVDDVSYVTASRLGAASQIRSSLVANVASPSLECHGAIVVNCASPRIQAKEGSILYNVISEEPIVAEAGQVMVGLSSGKLLQSRMDIDGGKVWKERLSMNELSFEEVHALNQGADIGALASQRQEDYNNLVTRMGL